MLIVRFILCGLIGIIGIEAFSCDKILSFVSSDKSVISYDLTILKNQIFNKIIHNNSVDIFFSLCTHLPLNLSKEQKLNITTTNVAMFNRFDRVSTQNISAVQTFGPQISSFLVQELNSISVANN